MTPLRPDELLALEQRFLAAMKVLPGSEPYTNLRPMNVGGAYDGLSVAEFLARQHPHRSADHWVRAQGEGRLSVDGKVLTDLERVVRAGNRLEHAIPDTVEPWVDHRIRFIYQDEDLLVIAKPAPLAIHPCGRFNRNSLVPMLKIAFPELEPRPVHRLDADTTGVVVLALSRDSARVVGRQFEARSVGKLYLARVHGSPSWQEELVEVGISEGPSDAGRRSEDAKGKSASTRIRVMQRDETTTLLEVEPQTGRTNQIRLHLASLGHAIVGDSAYGEAASPLEAKGQAMSGVSSLCLHAWRLSLDHPSTGVRMHFESPRPAWAEREAGIG